MCTVYLHSRCLSRFILTPHLQQHSNRFSFSILSSKRFTSHFPNWQFFFKLTLTRTGCSAKLKQMSNHNLRFIFYVDVDHFTIPSLAVHSESTGAFPFITTVFTTSAEQAQTTELCTLLTSNIKIR